MVTKMHILVEQGGGRHRLVAYDDMAALSKTFDPTKRPEKMHVVPEDCNQPVMHPDTKTMGLCYSVIFCDLIIFLWPGINIVPYEIKAYFCGHKEIKKDRDRDRKALEKVQSVVDFRG
jgi:hypothetical protein